MQETSFSKIMIYITKRKLFCKKNLKYSKTFLSIFSLVCFFSFDYPIKFMWIMDRIRSCGFLCIFTYTDEVLFQVKVGQCPHCVLKLPLQGLETRENTKKPATSDSSLDPDILLMMIILGQGKNLKLPVLRIFTYTDDAFFRLGQVRFRKG